MQRDLLQLKQLHTKKHTLIYGSMHGNLVSVTLSGRLQVRNQLDEFYYIIKKISISN